MTSSPLIEILDVLLPRVLFHRGEAGSPIPGMDLELVAVRIEKIERGPFATVILPDRSPRGSNTCGHVIEPGSGDAERDVGVLGQRRRARPLVQRQTEPQIADEQIGSITPSRQRPR